MSVNSLGKLYIFPGRSINRLLVLWIINNKELGPWKKINPQSGAIFVDYIFFVNLIATEKTIYSKVFQTNKGSSSSNRISFEMRLKGHPVLIVFCRGLEG